MIASCKRDGLLSRSDSATGANESSCTVGGSYGTIGWTTALSLRVSIRGSAAGQAPPALAFATAEGSECAGET